MTGAELRAGLRGAWQLARGDRGGLREFDESRRGVWVSFQAVILLCAVPTLATVVLGVTAGQVSRSGWGVILLVEAIGFVMRLAAFPLAMAPFCRWLDRDRQFVRFVVAYNWISVLQTAVYLAAAILALAVPGGGFLLLAALLVTMLYEWFTVSAALEVAALPATAVVLLDFVISLLVSRFSDGLY